MVMLVFMEISCGVKQQELPSLIFLWRASMMFFKKSVYILSSVIIIIADVFLFAVIIMKCAFEKKEHEDFIRKV